MTLTQVTEEPLTVREGQFAAFLLRVSFTGKITLVSNV